VEHYRDDVNQIKQGEHVFCLVDNTYTKSRGLPAHGGMWMEIQADTFLKRRPGKEGSERDYLSPESTGAHELGHTEGLDNWLEHTPNMKQEGEKRKFDNKSITPNQIETIYSESEAGHLNRDPPKSEAGNIFTRHKNSASDSGRSCGAI